MRKLILLVIMLTMGGSVFASNLGIDLEYGVFLSESKISSNGLNTNSGDDNFPCLLALNYKLNNEFSLYLGLQNWFGGTSSFDSQDLRNFYYLQIEGMALMFGGKYKFDNGIFIRGALGKAIIDGKYDYGYYYRQGGGSGNFYEQDKSVDVDNPMTADIAVGYQWFSERNFSFGLTTGYRYMQEITIDLPMDSEAKFNGNNPYISGNISIKF